MRNFQKEHFATLLKYLGISFITWGISHWFFSSERQIITSLLWVVIFVTWILLLKEKEEYRNISTLAIATLFAVSLWAFTGGMQHFPDSPERSALIVPLWAILSLYAFFKLEGENIFQKKYRNYCVLISLWAIILTLWLYAATEMWVFWEHVHNH